MPQRDAALKPRSRTSTCRTRFSELQTSAADGHVAATRKFVADRRRPRGEVIHAAKIVVGKVENQTPIFSANMRYVVFHPEWGVPDSIKVKEIAPYLRPSGGDFFSFFGGGAAHLKAVVHAQRSLSIRLFDHCDVAQNALAPKPHPGSPRKIQDPQVRPRATNRSDRQRTTRSQPDLAAVQVHQVPAGSEHLAGENRQEDISQRQ